MSIKVLLNNRWSLMAWLLLATIHGGHAWANKCIGEPLATHFTSADFAMLKPPRDIPVGSTILVKEIDQGKTTMNCNGDGLWFDYGFVGGATKTAYEHVYETGVPGIGMRIYWYNEGGVYMDWPRFERRITPNAYLPPHKFKFELVKTGTISSGKFIDHKIRIYYHNQLSNEILFNNVSYTAQSRGCTVARPVQTVTMPTVPLGKFKPDATPIGPKSFAIDLECDKGVKVAYYITGLNSNLHILKNSEGKGMAKGVGLLLVQGDASSQILQKLSTRTEFKTSQTTVDGELLSIPLTVFYFQYGPEVTAGDVLTNATVTFMYE
ncbi:fimbrial protein [Pseudomonas protegens]|uniref:fimbrial protein n=1 Tax=Pseudomonas protegens TaxID=380021 RepID=UPI002025A635|nr:fimbrial protein [Pseudomonas protegens]MCL9654559.1 fimbrial protein [Pseudomonas protegens]